METNFISYLFYLIIIVSGFYISGNLILELTRLSPIGRFAALFASLLLSQTLFVIIISVLVTGFRTINIALIPLIGLLWLLLKNTGIVNKKLTLSSINYKRQLSNLAVLWILCLASLGIRYWFGFGIHDFPSIHNDIIFYAKVSEYMWLFKRETYDIELIYKDSTALLPYHYFELWINGGISNLFKTSAISSLYLLVYSFGLVNITLGFCSIFEIRHKISPGIIILSFLGLFLTGIHFEKIQNNWFFDLGQSLTNNAFFYSKLFPVYLFLISAYLFYSHKRIIEASVILLILAFANVAVAPSIVSGLLLFGGFIFFRENKKKGLYIIGLTIGSSLFYLLFYKVYSSTNPASFHQDRFIEVIQNFIKPEYFKEKLLFGLKIIGQVIINYSPLALILYLMSYYRPDWRTLLTSNGGIFFLFLFMASLFYWIVFFDILNSFQFFTNIAIPTINILMIIWISYGIQFIYSKLTFFLPFVLTINLNITNTIRFLFINPENSAEYIRLVIEKTRDKNNLGGYIKDKTDYVSVFSKNSNVFPAGNYLAFSPYHKFPHTINLSVFEIPISKTGNNQNLEKELIETSSFYKYVQDRKNYNLFHDLEKSQIAFIKDYNIQYILVSKNGKIPKGILKLVKEVIIDPVSGERCYLLN